MLLLWAKAKQSIALMSLFGLFLSMHWAVAQYPGYDPYNNNPYSNGYGYNTQQPYNIPYQGLPQQQNYPYDPNAAYGQYNNTTSIQNQLLQQLAPQLIPQQQMNLPYGNIPNSGNLPNAVLPPAINNNPRLKDVIRHLGVNVINQILPQMLGDPYSIDPYNNYQGGYNQQLPYSYNQGGYNQQLPYSYNQGGYNQQLPYNYNQGGYNQQLPYNYNQGGYNQLPYNDNTPNYNNQPYQPTEPQYDDSYPDPNTPYDPY